MFPPALDSIMESCVDAFNQALENNASRKEFPDILQTDDAIRDFSQELARRMSQTYADVRLRQAKKTRPLCSCGAEMDAWAADAIRAIEARHVPDVVAQIRAAFEETANDELRRVGIATSFRCV